MIPASISINPSPERHLPLRLFCRLFNNNTILLDPFRRRPKSVSNEAKRKIFRPYKPKTCPLYFHFVFAFSPRSRVFSKTNCILLYELYSSLTVFCVSGGRSPLKRPPILASYTNFGRIFHGFPPKADFSALAALAEVAPVRPLVPSLFGVSRFGAIAPGVPPTDPGTFCSTCLNQTPVSRLTNQMGQAILPPKWVVPSRAANFSAVTFSCFPSFAPPRRRAPPHRWERKDWICLCHKR